MPPEELDSRDGLRRCITQSADLEVGKTLFDKSRTHTSFIPIATSQRNARNFISCHLPNMDITPTHMNVEEEPSTSTGTDRVLESTSTTPTPFGETSEIEAHDDLVIDEAAETLPLSSTLD
ncbi:hypothetical protein EB796_007618 [Bugula neritina]|uniref:Uncharacterized protein n=1 Tax=Bugula neritina TaxID=10212 RepID=A0A7J7K940_BUGNE|nr:hypothetical protein EB796_007618 [Bugula neritina]